jgi:hypothetical protein
MPLHPFSPGAGCSPEVPLHQHLEKRADELYVVAGQDRCASDASWAVPAAPHRRLNGGHRLPVERPVAHPARVLLDL